MAHPLPWSVRHALAAVERFEHAKAIAFERALADYVTGSGGLTIGGLVEEHTDLVETAFDKLTPTERMPFVEATALALRVFGGGGGRPKSGDVARRRKVVQQLLDAGMKPGEIAARLQIPAATIYQDVKRLKI
ncbi:MAG TPA: hypothetical protein PJ982_17910 [Lacipirellulaceae bacterium]|nr:hypothetical protein [Lacipirellulaceae bacterium]